MKSWRVFALFASISLSLGTTSIEVEAAPVRIVALGASNTAGKDAGGAPFPAQLEQLLKARGYDVQVINAGISGDTTAGMLNRLNSAVPEGTRLVILDPARANDNKRGQGSDRPAIVSEIRARLAARGIKIIVLPPLRTIAPNDRVGADHFTAAGHAKIAARLLPQVTAAIGRR